MIKEYSQQILISKKSNINSCVTQKIGIIPKISSFLEDKIAIVVNFFELVFNKSNHFKTLLTLNYGGAGYAFQKCLLESNCFIPRVLTGKNANKRLVLW